MRWDTAAALYCEILITRSVAMVTLISIATIGGSHFLAHVASTYQIWACYVMELMVHNNLQNCACNTFRPLILLSILQTYTSILLLVKLIKMDM